MNHRWYERMEFWFVLALFVAFMWGVDGILAKLSTSKLGVARIAVLIALVDGLMYFSAFYLWHSNVAISFDDALFATISCVVGTIAYLCFFESIVRGQIAIVGTITAAYPALTVIGAFVFLSETVTTTQATALTAIIGGVAVLAYQPNPHSRYATPRKSIFFATVAFALWGLWGLSAKIAITRVGLAYMFAFYAISALTVPLLYAWLRASCTKQMNPERPPRTAWTLGVSALAVNVIGVLALSFALERGPASLVVPISSAYPLVTIIMAVTLLREKLNRLHMLALAFVVIGLVLIGVTG